MTTKKNGLTAAFGIGLRRLDDPVWLIEDHLELGDMAALVGRRGSGKSFAAIDMACSVAAGTEWAGMSTTARPVVYAAGEGVRGVYERIASWCASRGINPDDLPLTVIDHGIPLHESTGRSQLRNYLEQAKNHYGDPVGLVVLDTWSRFCAGLDENSASEVNVFLEAIAELQREGPTTFLWVAHPAKGTEGREQTIRGSGASEAAMEWVYALIDEEDTHDAASGVRLQFTVACTKSKNHGEPADLRFQAFEQDYEFDFGKVERSGSSLVLQVQSDFLSNAFLRLQPRPLMRAIEATQAIMENQDISKREAGLTDTKATARLCKVVREFIRSRRPETAVPARPTTFNDFKELLRIDGQLVLSGMYEARDQLKEDF